MATTLTALPDTFSAGTTVKYRKSFRDYPASAGNTLKLYLAGASVREVAAEVDGDEFVITLSAALTGPEFVAGLYRWIERITTAASEVVEAAFGRTNITSDIAQATEGSEQEWVERAIAAVKAKIEERVKSGLVSYQVAGRAVQYAEHTALLQNLSALEARRYRLANPDAPFTRPVLVSFPKTGFDQ